MYALTATAEKLKIELSQSIQERAELAYFLIHSLDDDAEIAWDAELARRMQESNSGIASAEPLNKVFTELRREVFVKPVIIHSGARECDRLL